MLAAGLAAGAAIWLTTAWLLDTAESANPGTDRARVRVEAVRTGLAAGAGAGAAVGLLLAFRRQRHQEIATTLSDHDAGERRVTELYNAAAEQLGSDKAPVRLTALYTLERLANDNPVHRQTIVNIICAYLRMPFSAQPPTLAVSDEELAAVPPAERGTVASAAAEPVTTWHQERDVRLTAQRLLGTHLHSDHPVHWDGMSLALNGATLIDFTLGERCAIHEADFSDATFAGPAFFVGTFFEGYADFSGATFVDHAVFGLAFFAGHTTFARAFFAETARFVTASFAFASVNDFSGATFAGNVYFHEAKFSGVARFNRASFARNTYFNEATFADPVIFREDTAVFNDASVTDLQWEYVFPAGWRVEPAESDGGRLVKISGVAPSRVSDEASGAT